jgi:hypothetical protein
MVNPVEPLCYWVGLASVVTHALLDVFCCQQVIAVYRQQLQLAVIECTDQSIYNSAFDLTCCPRMSAHTAVVWGKLDHLFWIVFPPCVCQPDFSFSAKYKANFVVLDVAYHPCPWAKILDQVPLLHHAQIYLATQSVLVYSRITLQKAISRELNETLCYTKTRLMVATWPIYVDKIESCTAGKSPCIDLTFRFVHPFADGS